MVPLPDEVIVDTSSVVEALIVSQPLHAAAVNVLIHGTEDRSGRHRHDRCRLLRTPGSDLGRQPIVGNAPRDCEPSPTMYDSYIVKRTQIYLADSQDDDLARRAAAEGITKSALIRRAVDEYLANGADDDLRLTRFRAAVDAVAGAAPDLPQGSLYVEQLRALDASRQKDIERRRRA